MNKRPTHPAEADPKNPAWDKPGGEVRLPSSADLQAESQGLLARIRPLTDAMDMAIRRNEPGAADAVADACREFRAIQKRFAEVQELIASGAATERERVRL